MSDPFIGEVVCWLVRPGLRRSCECAIFGLKCRGLQHGPILRSKVFLIGAVVFATSFTPATAAQQFFGRVRGPDSLILQGPGSEIRASVTALPTDRRPQGQTGVVIEQVDRRGPADDAGLRRGDIVTEFDGVAITDPVQFGRTVRDTPPGRRVMVVVWREANRREIFITPVVARPS